MSFDYTVGDTFHVLFTTRQFSTGAPFLLAGSPAVAAYEDLGLTEITAGVTLAVDHDTIVGLNSIAVVATGGNGFETGKTYHLVLTAGTVDGITVVGEVVGEFTLGRSAAAVDLANGTDGLTALAAQIAALNNVSTAQVLTQVNAAIDTAISELGVAQPTATPTIRTALMLMYMALRNKLDVQTSGVDSIEIHNAAGTEITQKLVTDDGSDYSEAQMT